MLEVFFQAFVGGLIPGVLFGVVKNFLHNIGN